MIKTALSWANQFSYCCFFNNNNIASYPFKPYKNLIAVSNRPQSSHSGNQTFSALQQQLKNKRWLIGHLSYDLKNQLERLQSKHKASIDFPLLHFYEPEHLLHLENDSLTIETDSDPEILYSQICSHAHQTEKTNVGDISTVTTRQAYIDTVNKLLEHIIAGDMYEINYCIEFIIEKLQIDPISFYLNLCTLSPTPFSFFYKINGKYALGASPERFLKKEADKLISQPIKGTARRGANETEDEQIKLNLYNDEKERAENMMIVDLVRNDLAKSAKSGTVKVEEMFGIYSFQHWHQMISTVSAIKAGEVDNLTSIKNAFPMGSMTGAPKIKVMELIEQYETFRRGLYAGAIGYFTPEGDFDFNVVIRTLFYDQQAHKGSFMVGSAITSDAIPEKEFEECLLKIKPIIKALELHAGKESVDFSIKDN